MKQYCGIDIGKDGGVAIIEGTKIELWATPKIGAEIDLRGLAKILKNIKQDAIVVVEDVHSLFRSSAKSTFQFGRSLGLIEMGLVVSEIPFIKVAPKTWQKEMWEGIPVMKKPSSTKKTMVNNTKAMSLLAASRLWPKLSFVASERSTVSHDGIVDALLMAEFGRRKY